MQISLGTTIAELSALEEAAWPRADLDGGQVVEEENARQVLSSSDVGLSEMLCHGELVCANCLVLDVCVAGWNHLQTQCG